MFREIDAQCYIIVDGDDTYPAQSAREMADLVLNHHADMVVGDRLSSTYFTENKRLFHNFGNRLVRCATNAIFKCDIKDIMTGYRAFSYTFVKSFPVLSRGFEIETEMSIHAIDKNMQVENVIVDYRDRQQGSESKLNTISDGIKVLRTIARMFANYKPLLFFGCIAALLAVISTAFFVPVFGEYLHTGLVPKIPTLITCGFVYLTALLFFFTGLNLSNLRRRELREFEYHIISVEDRYNTLMKEEGERK